MKWLVLSLLNIIVYIPGLMLRYVPFARLYSGRQKKLLFLGQGILLVVNSGIFYFLGTHEWIGLNYGKLSLLLFGIFATGVNILVLRDRWRELLFTCGFSLLVGHCLLTTVVYGLKIAIGMDSVDDYFVGMLAFLSIFVATFPIWRKMLLNSVTPFLSLESGGYWKTIWFIPIGMFLTCFVAVPGETYAETIFQLLSRFFMLIAAIFVCRGIARDPAVMLAQLEMEHRLNLQEEYYTQLAEQVEKARKSRHDFKHHIMAIREYMKQDDKEGLALYCDRLLERNQVETEIPYTGNSAVDGVIYHYALLAKEHNIRFDYPAVCRNPGLEDMDLCVLLGNALDNAVAGCLTVENDRYITIVAECDRLSLRLLISNSFDGNIREEKGKLFSRKRENRIGVGMDSMRAVCEKYDAAMDIRYSERDFHVLFVFAMADTSG